MRIQSASAARLTRTSHANTRNVARGATTTRAEREQRSTPYATCVLDTTKLTMLGFAAMPADKYFTIDEANALIPRLEMLMARTQRAALHLRSELQNEGSDSESDRPLTTADVLRTRPDLAATARELESAVEEIEALGCQFKGIDLGLVDFPTRIDGSTVLLCWQYGEKQIAFWHRTDEGFAGRRPLASVERPHLQ